MEAAGDSRGEYQSADTQARNTPAYKDHQVPKHSMKISSKKTVCNDICTEGSTDKIIIDIELPLIDAATQLDLDVSTKRVLLKSEVGSYKLDLTLPHPVEADQGCTHFHKNQHVLTLTLPVITSAEDTPASSCVNAAVETG